MKSTIRKIFVGTEIAKTYKTYKTLAEARKVSREREGFVDRLYTMDKRFVGYIVSRI